MAEMQFIPKSALDEHQQRAWVETKAGLLYEGPYWSHLLYTLMSGGDNEQAMFVSNETGGAGFAAMTDGKRVVVNVDEMLSRPLGERIYITAHEVTHASLNHPELAYDLRKRGKVTYSDGVELPYNDEVFEYALDIFVNNLLDASEIGTRPAGTRFDKKYPPSMSSLEIYRDLMPDPEEQPPGGDSGGDAPPPPEPPPPGFDKHLPPGTCGGQTPEEAKAERQETPWQSEMMAAADSAKAQGKLSKAMEEALGKLVKPEFDWKEHMRSLMARTVGTGGYDFKHPDRRLITREDPIIAPGRRGFKCKLAAVIGDSSGSINTATANHFFGHLAGIIDDLEPERILFTWCDTDIQGWRELDDPAGIAAIQKEGMKRRGGTSFCKPFDYLATMGEEPDVLIYMTDGDGVFPSQPNYQVIWADISGKASKYPFGDVVQIPVRK